MLAGEWPLVSSSFVPLSSLVPSEPLDDLALNEKQMTQNVNLLYVPFWCEGLSCCGSRMSTLLGTLEIVLSSAGHILDSFLFLLVHSAPLILPENSLPLNPFPCIL